jgi:hypothetical protein
MAFKNLALAPQGHGSRRRPAQWDTVMAVFARARQYPKTGSTPLLPPKLADECYTT